MDWDLQRRVALIDAEDDFKVWKDGPEAVAKEIARIEQDFRTRVDRAAVFERDAGVFRLEDDPAPPLEALEFACKRVLLALENALASGTSNGLREDSYETIAIRSAVEQHPDDASVIAVSFFDACMSFDKRIGDEYPDDLSLTSLKNALWRTVEEITELDDPAKARVQRYVQLGQATPLTVEEQKAVPRSLKK